MGETPVGVCLLQDPCSPPNGDTSTPPAPGPTPYLSPYTLPRLANLQILAKQQENTLAERIGSSLVLPALQAYPRELVVLVTKVLNITRAVDPTMRAEVLSEIKYWLYVFTVYAEYVALDERSLLDSLHLSPEDAIDNEAETTLLKTSTLICEIHLTIHTNGMEEDPTIYEPIRNISYLPNLLPGDMYIRNYIIFYDLGNFLSYAITFFSDWAEDIAA